MDVIMFVVSAFLSALAATCLIFFSVSRVDAWSHRRVVLIWLCGLGVAIAAFVLAANVPKGHTMYASACDPLRDTGCRATGAVPVGPGSDTICCFPGVREDVIESKTPIGEAEKIGLIVFGVGILFGLVVLVRQRVG